MNNRKTKRKIREALGLPNDNGKIIGLVSEDPYELCENTMTSKSVSDMHPRANKMKHTPSGGAERATATLRTPHSAFLISESEAEGFDFGASGGATSPNTEVNADHQGVISEVPRSEKKPKSKG